jgi:hypothetical protein
MDILFFILGCIIGGVLAKGVLWLSNYKPRKLFKITIIEENENIHKDNKE